MGWQTNVGVLLGSLPILGFLVYFRECSNLNHWDMHDFWVALRETLKNVSKLLLKFYHTQHMLPPCLITHKLYNSGHFICTFNSFFSLIQSHSPSPFLISYLYPQTIFYFFYKNYRLQNKMGQASTLQKTNRWC